MNSDKSQKIYSVTLKFKFMIVFIESESNDAFSPDIVSGKSGYINRFIVPVINSENNLVMLEDSMSYFNELTKLVSPYNVYNINTKGIDKELLGVTIGYLMTSGVMTIADDKELQKKLDFLLDGKIPEETDKKVYLIKKIIYLRSCQFKKFNSIVSELKFENTLEDYILDALMMMYGAKPILKGTESKFINSITKFRGIWD